MSATADTKPGRLKKRPDFLRLRDAGKKWVSPSVIVQADASGAGAVRFGLTATKKLGGAVVRNRIRRRMREAAQAVLKNGAHALPFDIVLIGRDATATCPFPTLIKDLRWCLRKLGVLEGVSDHGKNIPAKNIPVSHPGGGDLAS